MGLVSIRNSPQTNVLLLTLQSWKKKSAANVAVVHVSVQLYVLRSKIGTLLCSRRNGKAGEVLELHVPAKVADFSSVGQTGGTPGVSPGAQISACAGKT